MDAPRAPAGAGHALPPRRKSLLAESSPCWTCGKGATETCATCNKKVCMGCLASSGSCNSCVLIAAIQMDSQDKKTVISKFSMFFPKTNKVRPNGNSAYARTPDRAAAYMEAPASGFTGKMFGFFRRNSNTSSRNLNFLEEDARHASPQPESAARARRNLDKASAPPCSENDNSDEVLIRLQREMENMRLINAELAQENAKLKTQSTAPLSNEVGVPSAAEVSETEQRVRELQLELEMARGEIIRIGNVLMSVEERERQMELYMNSMLAQSQQQQQQPSANGRSRSAVPPCVPFPGTNESAEWLNSIQQGTYQDYWQTAAASQSIPSAGGLLGGLPLPPPLTSSSSVSASGRKRSEIPPAPPLPAGMKPVGPRTGLPLNTGPLRGGSAPNVLQVVEHQKKRPAVFVSTGVAKAELKPLFWTTLNQTRIQGTIFEKLAEKPVVKPEAIKPQVSALVTRFAKRAAKFDPKAAANGAATAEVKAPAAPRVQIMDSKRRQQIGIGLSGLFRGISAIELKKAIVALDHSMLSPDRIAMLLEMIPKPDELSQLDQLRAGSMLDATFLAEITKEEMFFLEVSMIPRLQQRLLCMMLECTFDNKVEKLTEDLANFSEAIKVIKLSQRWKQFLALCLETGNYLNEDSPLLGGAWGFSLKEGLKRFSEMKTCENNSNFTLMHWIAEVAASHCPELFQLREEFQPVSEASTQSVEELKKEVQTFKVQLDVVRVEVEKCKVESSDLSSKFLTPMVPFLEQKLTVHYAKLQAKMEEVEREATQLVVMHGENPQQTSCKEFFEIILEGITSFLKANQDNLAVKLAEQKALLQQQNSARKIAQGGENAGAKREQNRIMKDTGVSSGQGKHELEAAMAKRRKAPQ